MTKWNKKTYDLIIEDHNKVIATKEAGLLATTIIVIMLALFGVSAIIFEYYNIASIIGAFIILMLVNWLFELRDIKKLNKLKQNIIDTGFE